MSDIRHYLANIFFTLLLALLACWSVLAVWYSDLSDALRAPAAALVGACSLACMALSWRDRRLLSRCALGYAVLIAWWLLCIPASNSRDWQPDVAVLPWADRSGDRVTIHNVRNCDYRTETEYTPAYYDATLDLQALRSLDFYQVYWGSPLIAHTMLSFGFDGGQYVCFSIETRKETGEDYSALKGFFKQYELIYVVADERDLVRLRTNFRGEDVYLFRLSASRDVIRKVFVDYLEEVNSLKAAPQWYNALTSNCTTNIRSHTAPYNPKARLDWRIIVNGHVDELLYEQGYLDRSLPLPELKKASHINAKAKQAGDDPRFSELVRRGLPGMN